MTPTETTERAEVLLEQLVEGINATTLGYVEEHQETSAPSLALAALLQHMVKTYAMEAVNQKKPISDVTDYLFDLIDYAKDIHKAQTTLAQIIPAQSE